MNFCLKFSFYRVNLKGKTNKQKTKLVQQSTSKLIESTYLNIYVQYFRWLNTVLAVCEYLSFAISWQEKGCSSQAETWQEKNILMKDFDVIYQT